MRRRIIFILIAIGILFAVGFMVYRDSLFRITGTDPSLSSVYTWTPFVKLNFNRQLSSQNVYINSSPNVLYSPSYTLNGNTLYINLAVPLKQGVTYKINLVHINDKSGDELKNKTIKFVAGYLPKSQLPQDQQEELIRRSQQSAAYKDPILQHIPYYSIDFNLLPSVSTGNNSQVKLSLTAQLFIPAADSGDPSNAIANDKQEVADFIQSLGLNPLAYDINYQVVGP